MVRMVSISYRKVLTPPMYSVRLGNSGLKVSRIILGTMQYGNKGWQEWVLGEDEAVEHIKTAFVVIFNNMSMVVLIVGTVTKQEFRRLIPLM
jgi:hypothetical protein